MKRFATPLLVLALGCSTKTVEVGQLDHVLDLPAIPNPDVDILFVIDNSPSMTDKQNAMIESFPKMMDALQSLPGGLPNIHIGVVTSDMGTKGSFDSQAGPGVGSGPGSCSGSGNAGKLQNIDATTGVPVPELNGAVYISDIANEDGTRTRNYTGELRDVFTKIASVGANGCGFEQHFAAMRAALVDNPANADFVRRPRILLSCSSPTKTTARSRTARCLAPTQIRSALSNRSAARGSASHVTTVAAPSTR